MESSGLPGKIQISKACGDLLQLHCIDLDHATSGFEGKGKEKKLMPYLHLGGGIFTLVERGGTYLKGLGNAETYWLEAP